MAKTYDYIVIGAGAAGCVLANRLSADPGTSVLLLEAGGRDVSPLVHIPAGFSMLMGTKANWIFDTVPQKFMRGRRMFLPQGKVLGGSTAVNAMLYVRGNRGDYDGWRDLGNKGWGYDDVLPYFKVQERNERLAGEYHGVDGELNVADQVQHNPMSNAFVRAAQEAGIPYTADPNGATQEGVFYHQVTQRKARRESAATAFLHPVRKRRNLTVRTGADVTRILVTDKRAHGVVFASGGKQFKVEATREVILSAGAINSPRLLLLSGIGPADELRAIGIEPVHDLPGVGKNLHDQLEVYITAEAAEPVTYSGENRPHRAALHALQYLLYRTGPATATITEAGAFVHSSDDVAYPDIQLHMLPAYVVWKDLARSADKVDGHGITILACHIRPKSRGEVTLTCADPAAPPAVNPNYLSHPDDLDVAVKGFRWIRKVLAAEAFRPYLKQERLPGRQVETDEEIRDFIIQWGKTDYHPVGSCKMGVDELAVVDPELRVRGIDGLRVIDSSIMPSIISGNTQAPSMMIGEKGAALVLGREPV
ncbi:choline dehydrogenase [Paractinoplanes ferrugineus]|uniref:Alanine-phosphoribitol ligase n=1 Tax=Paractinoplanes ferrugineus TaxID=113564 RepID=A0A919J258_9ACTN|nr:choline dehydrogenase [Actinoplanes ferrugineus]GIE13135.1 alanine-phosphoribitol ligase [Actinoplanes ferrugineus]